MQKNVDHLFKAVTLVDSSSSFNGQSVDILIKEGRIHKMDASISEEEVGKGVQVITEESLCCSIGWFDLSAFTGEPGYEHRETLDSFMKAAALGGFTEVACLPNVQPMLETKAALELLKQKSVAAPVQLHPLAAVTHHLEGRDLAELLDLHQAGAVAFSDGLVPIQSEDTLLKALNYIKLFNGVLMNHPVNLKIAAGGQIHEGVVSTQLGLKGIPAIAEEVQVARDLQLLEYTGGRLHFSQLSTAGALEAVRVAKKKGLQVTCDVAAHQCAFIDETIEPFDTNYKVSPPFRSEQDRQAIIAAIQDGTIDALVSAHTPCDVETKELEFDLADVGIIGLQTAFAAAVGSTKGAVPYTRVVEMFTSGARQVLGLPSPQVVEGAVANLTFFNPEKEWRFTEENNASVSKNSPFLGKTLIGEVYGTYFNGHFTLNPAF